MKYTMLLWPHSNARYQNETHKLAAAELTVLLRCVAPDVEIRPIECLQMPALELIADASLSKSALTAICTHSLLYGLFVNGEAGELTPVAGRDRPYLGADLPGILKYKGKTNELFTQLLMNVALYSGSHWQNREPIRLLDPMCGRATALFVGANRRWMCTGVDVDRNDLKEAETFFKRYLEYHHLKHRIERGSLTIRGEKPAPSVQFAFSDTVEHYKQKDEATLRLVHGDATRVFEAFGRNAFHMVVADLPYGVQHSAHGGGLDGLLARALPGWRNVLVEGGTVGVSFNAQTLKAERVRVLMREAGLETLEGGAYGQFSHWVEQAVTRDIVVGKKITQK